MALEDGFEGTEKEWLESLVGPKGDQGMPGRDYILTESDKQEIAAKAAVLASGIPHHICAADEVDENGVPKIEEPDEDVFYLVRSGDESPDLFFEWAYIDGSWERFGSAAVDLTDYIKQDEADAIVKHGIASNTLQLNEEEQAAAQAWLGGMMLKLLPADTNIYIFELNEGIYRVKAGAQIRYSTDNKKLPTSTDGYLTLMRSTASGAEYKTFIFLLGQATLNSITMGWARSDTGTAKTLLIETITTDIEDGTFSGVKTFSAQPLMTAELATQDNSKNIPNTEWVNAAITSAIGTSLDTLEAIIDESGVLS